MAEGKNPSLSGTFDNGMVDIPYKKAPIYPVYTEADIQDAVEQGWYKESDFD